MLNSRVSPLVAFSYFLFAWLILLSLKSYSQISQEPITFNNFYKARLYGFTIKVTNRLTKVGENQYDMLFEADSMLGTITETSRMEWLPSTKTIRPLQYTYGRRSIGKNRAESLSFDWNKKLIINNIDKTSWEMATEKPIQDKLSYQIQMQQDLLDNKNDFFYLVPDGNQLKDYEFTNEGEEVLDTPLGKVTAIKIKRGRSDDKRVTLAWLAKDWSYLLVQLQQKEKGSTYTIYIQKATSNGKVIEHF